MHDLSKFYCWSSLIILASCTPAPNHTLGGNLGAMNENSGSNTGGENPIMLPQSPNSKWNCTEVYNAVSECYTTYSECATSCEGQSCATACEDTYGNCAEFKVAMGSSSAQTEYNTVRSCEEENYQSCYDKGGEVYNSCTENCSDDACRNACADDAGQVLQSCMQENCNAAYDACGLLDNNQGGGSNNGGNNGGGSNNGTEPFTCGQLYDCEDACAGNRSCGQRCYDNGTEAAKTQWSRLIECGQSRCDGNVADAAEYKQCLQSQCSSDYGICFESGGGSTGGGSTGGGSTGGGSTGGSSGCGQGYMCVQGCYATTDSEDSFYNCVDSCYDQMSVSAHTLMEDLVTCSRRECTGVTGSVDNYFRCQRDYCPSEHAACLAN